MNMPFMQANFHRYTIMQTHPATKCRIIKNRRWIDNPNGCWQPGGNKKRVVQLTMGPHTRGSVTRGVGPGATSPHIN